MSLFKSRGHTQQRTGNKFERLAGGWFLRLLIALTFLLLLCLSAAAQTQAGLRQILVKPKPRVPDADVARRIQAVRGRAAGKLLHMNVHVVRVATTDADRLLDSLRRDSEIEYAEPDGIAQAAFVPNDPYVTSGSEWHLAKIQAPGAWNITSGQSNVLIAVLDSGITVAHPDLAGRIVPGFNFVSGTDDTDDDLGHGTAVAGTVVAAGNNSLGVAGVAFGCSILPVKVVNGSGFAWYSAIADGIHYAVDHGARVINISIAGDSPSITLQEAVDYAWSNNVVLVAAAGNNGTSVPQYPAACDHVIGVSATEPDDSLASFSSYGPFVSLSAPGDNIWTTQRDPAHPYGAWRGTSFASPIASSVAGLIASVNPALSSDQIVSIMETSADDLGSDGYDTNFGHGRVNALQSLLLAAISPGAPTAPPETAIIRYEIFGPGRVVPVLNGKALPLGQTCRFKAIPGPGHVFAGWNGLGQPAPFADIEFVVQSNLTLVASFVPSPYPAFKGSYAGLILNTNQITTDNSGYVRLNLSDSGRFTGAWMIGGARRGFAGQCNATGDARIDILSAEPLSLNLHLDLFSGSGQLTGAISGRNWTSELLAFRNEFKPRSNPAPQTGARPLALDENDASASTNAAFGIVRINPGGTVYSRGSIGGVWRFGWTSIISRSGDYPFYLSHDHGAEVLIGWLNLPAHSIGSTGSVLWLRNNSNTLASVLKLNAR